MAVALDMVAPDKATRRFVHAIRQSGEPDRPVFVAVVLASPDAPELSVWRDRLRLLEDPFVSVEPVVARNQGLRSVTEGG